jgi:hypothetical protein
VAVTAAADDRGAELLDRLSRAAEDRRQLMAHGQGELAESTAAHIRRVIDQAASADLRAIVARMLLDSAPTDAPSRRPAGGRPRGPVPAAPAEGGVLLGAAGPVPSPRRSASRRREPVVQLRNVALDRAPALAWSHRREPGHLVKVAEYQGVTYLQHIGASGMPAPRARWRAITAARLGADFAPYLPCRWTLECLQPATTVVHHTAHADRDDGAALGDVDVCSAHAAEHHQWRQDNQGRPHRNWSEEPAPECMCTDTDRANGTVQDYCPRHGTVQHRGIELPPSLLVDLGGRPESHDARPSGQLSHDIGHRHTHPR